MNAWEEVLKYLKTKVNAASYQVWLRPTRLSHVSQDALVVQVPSREFQDWIQEHYGSLINQVLSQLHPNLRNVRYIVDEDSDKALHVKVDIDSVDQQLSPRYTFDTFVVGTFNQFAHGAARAVAEAPGKAYNPLVIYGGVGSGKTHLLQAIGHVIKRKWKEMRLAYVSSENFANEVMNSLRYDRMISFRDKYRNVDILLMDDIQFIAGKKSAEEEFFHTFNTLYESQRQVVISSVCPPTEIPGLEERLRSRFAWGLTADLQAPDVESKMCILAKRCESQGVHLAYDVIYFVARKIESGIRDLEGALTRLIAYSSLTGTEITLSMAQQVLKSVVDTREQAIEMHMGADSRRDLQVAASILEVKVATGDFDVFLAHNSDDKQQVSAVGERLKERGLYPWIDSEQVPPGQWFQDAIQKAIPGVKAAAVFIGSRGLGRWQAVELRALVSRCVDAGIPVIPVLLPGVTQVPSDLPFLREFSLVRFSQDVNEHDALEKLEWGITGERPARRRESK